MGKNDILVSVVIPLYNKEQTIVHTLKTVVAQTYNNFEVIIVDDGSTDNSVQVIRDNIDDGRIRIVQQENGGVSSARNKGIEEATGELVAFLDADDEWLQNYLETMVEAASKYDNADVILVGRYYQDFKSKRRYDKVPPRYKNKCTFIDFFENPHVYMHISATVVRMSCLKQQTEWNRFIVGQKNNEDFTFLFRLVMHYQKVLYIGFPLSVYNGNVEGQTTSILQNAQRLNGSILFRNLVWDEFDNMTDGPNKRKFKLFMKYELRHSILCFLRDHDNKQIANLLDGLSVICVKNCLNRFEQFLYRHSSMDKYSIVYIYLTKIIWKLHFYPQTK